MLMSFIYRHHLTNAGVEDLLDMLTLLCPGCLPSSKFLLTKGLLSARRCIERHMYCNVCFAYVCKYVNCCTIDKCQYCNSAFNCEKSLKDGNFFLYMSIEKQHCFPNMNQLRSLLLCTHRIQVPCLMDVL